MEINSIRSGRAITFCLALTAALFGVQCLGISAIPGLWYGVYLLIASWVLKIASFAYCAFIIFNSKLSKAIRYIFVIVFASILLLHFPFGISTILGGSWVGSELRATCGASASRTLTDVLPCVLWVAASWVELFLKFSVLPILTAYLMVTVIAKKDATATSR